MEAHALNDVPDADSAVVAARHAVLAVGGNGANSVGVALKAVVVERVRRWRHRFGVSLASVVLERELALGERARKRIEAHERVWSERAI